MSWQDDIQQDFTIQTGDNEVYTVLWNKASKTVAWNSAMFSYIGIRGQYARKEEALARQFPLDFYFQGPDHLETSQRFENSLNDKNPCLITHPLYGNIICQIFTVTFDNSELNVTKITGTAIETLTESGLVVPNPYQVVQLEYAQINTDAPEEVTDLEISTSDASDTKNTIKDAKTDGMKIITVLDEAKQYTNAFNTALNYVNAITSLPVLAMAAVCNFVSLPGKFTALVKDRISFLESQFQRMIDTVLGKSVNPVQKKLFEIQAASNIAATCLAAITPTTSSEYTTTKTVLEVATRIGNMYNTMVETLDSLEVSAGGPDEYYTYSADLLSLVSDTVNTTIANLMQIALSGKQERFVYTSVDSNAILLAHRYYGPSNDDSNLQYFVDTNNLTIPQLLQIKKGTKIVYYN